MLILIAVVLLALILWTINPELVKGLLAFLLIAVLGIVGVAVALLASQGAF